MNFKKEDINKEQIIRDLFSLTDIFIFYNKNKLYNILKQFKEEEDNYNANKLYMYYQKESERKKKEKEDFKQKEEEEVKKFKRG